MRRARVALWAVASLSLGWVAGGGYPIAAAASARDQAAPAASPATVVLAEYDGIIHPIAAEFFDEVLTRADASGARAAVILLRTPGGLLDSTRTIVTHIIAARTPVVVYIAPSGSRAASAGFIITLAADVAAMAPGTHVGAAHPVESSGQAPIDPTMNEKVAEDTAAYARTLAASRHRNVALAADAVLHSRAFTEQEALTADPPLVDLVARDLDDLMRQLDGRRVLRFDGRQTTLETTAVTFERIEMTRRQRFLSTLAHPQIAYLLLSLGMLGLVVELWNPGAIAPGVVGGISLLLALFAFQVIPVNVSGVLLILLGVVLLLLEIKVPSFGILGIGGVISLLVGSVMVTSEVPGVRVSYGVIVPVALAFSAILLFLGRLALAAQRLRPVTGADGLINEEGRAMVAFGHDVAGQITVHGEIWRALSHVAIAPGARVRVLGVDGLTLTVEPVSEPSSRRIEQGDTR
jgi:membrane-bound serine protease (ClpP class)